MPAKCPKVLEAPEGRSAGQRHRGDCADHGDESEKTIFHGYQPLVIDRRPQPFVIESRPQPLVIERISTL